MVPPAGGETNRLRRLVPRPWVGRLSPDRDWLVATPMFVDLEDGLVKSTSRGNRDEPSVAKKPDKDASPSPAVAEGDVDSPAQSQSEDMHELGYVACGSQHRFEFLVENPHDEDLVIDDVLIECDCMRPVDPPARIAAGGSAEFLVEFDAGKKPLRYPRPALRWWRGRSRRPRFE